MAKLNKEHTDPVTMNHLLNFVAGINEYARSAKMLPF